QALRLVQWLSGGGGAVEPINLYRITDAIAGLLYLGLIFHFLRALSIPAADAVLLGILLLFRVGTQFFLGYVENYMFFYVALTAYVVTGWLALEKKAPLWLPLILLAAVPGFHIAGIIFLPTVIFLLLPWWKSHRRYFLMGIAGIAVVSAAGILLLGPSWVMTRIADAIRNDFLPISSPPGGIPYGIFSTAHLIDWVNANLHIAPFSLVCVAIGMIAVRREEYSGSPVFRFLAGSTLVGLTMSFVILPGLGMARDWDMLSNFFIPLRFFSVYFLMLLLRARELRHAVLMLAVVGLVRWFGWVGINADEEKHLARAEVLTAPELSGTFPKIYYEHLGKTFFDRKDFPRAAKWYEAYVKIDSMNPRILANLSDCYRALGDGENVFRMLRLSVEAKSTNPGVYSNLAVEYVHRGDTGRAISLLEDAVRLDPALAIARANLCLLNMRRGRYAEARQAAAEAIRLGMREPVLFKEAGYASYYLKDYPSAILSLNEYLKSVPSDEHAKKLYYELERRLGKDSPLKKTARPQ
ncbi:MAG TPA: tetratricopeptide repeat protein, partial [Bacteroidota bacterium]|nr:tetratricopeptide repeat protein [Bacteroidota bacterium]